MIDEITWACKASGKSGPSFGAEGFAFISVKTVLFLGMQGPSYQKKRLLVSMQGFMTKTAPLDKRKALLWFRTKCLPYIMEGKGRYVNGHRFCHHVSIALGKAGSDVDVSCTDKQLGGHPLPFRWAALPIALRRAGWMA